MTTTIRHNNIVRIGPVTKGGPFRVSLGAQRKHWLKLPVWRQKVQPIHVHGTLQGWCHAQSEQLLSETLG